MPVHTFPPATLSRKLSRAIAWDNCFLSMSHASFMQKGLHLIPKDEAHVLLAYGVNPSAIVVYDKDPEILLEALDAYPGIKCINDDFFAAAKTYQGKLQTCVLDVGKHFSLETYDKFIDITIRLKPKGCSIFYFASHPEMPEIDDVKKKYTEYVAHLARYISFQIIQEAMEQQPANVQLNDKGELTTARASILYEYLMIATTVKYREMHKVASSHCLYLPSYRMLDGYPCLGLVLNVDCKRPGESKYSFQQRRIQDAHRGAFDHQGKEIDEEVFKDSILSYYGTIKELREAPERVAQMFGIEKEVLLAYIEEEGS